jgi:hypothetical protein
MAEICYELILKRNLANKRPIHKDAKTNSTITAFSFGGFGLLLFFGCPLF